uniref:Uncharacterized protein n=1 Tax=Mola mola TaxID=94237 RepID=A0A3Q3XQ16_MOLML
TALTTVPLRQLPMCSPTVGNISRFVLEGGNNLEGKTFQKSQQGNRTKTLSCSEPSLESDFYLSLPEDIRSVKWKVAGGHERGAAAGTVLPDWRSQSDDRNPYGHLCEGA